MSLDQVISSTSAQKSRGNHLSRTPVSIGEHSTVKRVDLADAVVRHAGLSHSDSKWMVDLVLMEIAGAMIRGEDVKLSGFGSFKLRSKSARVGRNPKTGVEATISPRSVIVFKASHRLDERINAA